MTLVSVYEHKVSYVCVISMLNLTTFLFCRKPAF